MSDRYERFEGLRVERRDHGVLLVTIDRAEKLNATNAPIHRSLGRIWPEISDDPATRVAVVTGAGTAFSSGGDLEWISGQVENYPRTMWYERTSRQFTASKPPSSLVLLAGRERQL